MPEKCQDCGMIRATKDLVLREENYYICFSCWNKSLMKNREKAEE
jgi:hypothetical protein